jgi:hypothetical protein
MFSSQLVRTTMLWGSEKKKAAKPSNPWVRYNLFVFLPQAPCMQPAIVLIFRL